MRSRRDGYPGFNGSAAMAGSGIPASLPMSGESSRRSRRGSHQLAHSNSFMIARHKDHRHDLRLDEIAVAKPEAEQLVRDDRTRQMSGAAASRR
jgi:hypothetical protein